MPVVTGTLWDMGLGHLVSKHPELVWTLNAPNAKASGLFTTEPVRTTPAADGSFSATLASTTDMQDEAWIRLSVQWSDAAGNFQKVDFPDWRIEVPTTGGSFPNLITGPAGNSRMVYVSLTPPEDPRPFSLWIKQEPNDPANPANTGLLYEWRNV
ncbi:hypothetical protein [Arthrobacter sp. R-11]|uniref:hypothetical protein n=1 Tax=Arthrobacter sp. R-11 TaxID=3404053 RepID=UPI003CE83BFE